jgi:hypothetical protein
MEINGNIFLIFKIDVEGFTISQSSANISYGDDPEGAGRVERKPALN